MKKIPILLLSIALAMPAARAQTENSRLLFTQIDTILHGLSQITGWKVKHKVPADYINRDQLHDYIQGRIKKEVKPEELRVQTVLLKMFGLVPPDFDLRKTTIALMTEQAAAFYDYDRKRLFIIESQSSFLEKRVALVHELAHALADQHFPLGRYVRKGAKDDDASTAREAVMEGQATWLMWAYVSKLGGGDAAVPDMILNSAVSDAESSGSEYPVFEHAPLYLRESLIFPYTYGLLFQQALYKKLGKEGFSRPFRVPPVSTQQILHPQLYFDRAQPVKPALPRIADRHSYRSVADGTMGEFDHQVLIWQFTGKKKAERLAPHWRGGAFRLYERKKDKRPLLAYASAWDTPAAAREYFDVYRAAMHQKWKSIQIAHEGPASIEGSGDSGGFILRLVGTTVTSLEGIPPER
jgi:hypothetical protein